MKDKHRECNYARWLVMLRKALLATGCFEKGVYPSPEGFRHYFDSGFTPYQAAKMDTGVAPSGYYLELDGRYPHTKEKA